MPLDLSQKYGGAQECKWQAISPRVGREDPGADSSALRDAAVVPPAVLDRLHPDVTGPTQRAIATMSHPSRRMPCICER